VSDFEETYGSSVNARMASHVGEEPPHPVEDVGRNAVPGPPPVEGAQWDEVHSRWEAWDETAGEWTIVGDPGDGVPIVDENQLPPLLARELLLADDLESHHDVVPDIERASPVGPAPRGAQWNEVTDRWERWDEASDAWVEAAVEPDAPDAS
jgi:hypothetical protein